MAAPFPRRARSGGFTLIELLVAIAVIIILAAIVIMAGEGLMKFGGKSRAKAEIAAMSSALEAYKTDNGVYPQYSGLLPSSYNEDNTIAPGENDYQNAATLLYAALSGKNNYADTTFTYDAANNLANKSYMNFASRQLGNWKVGSAAATYVQDPFGNPYGYSTGGPLTQQANANGQTEVVNVPPPNNGSGNFDLWSTGGQTPETNPNWTAAWIQNW
jgi:prepilin-type N-terminal cleavage/methylation domain-containing protein